MSRYVAGGVEPSLEEMLDDPVVQAVMERDGVTDERVRASLSHARHAVKDHPGHARPDGKRS
jgi:hypothetical protein